MVPQLSVQVIFPVWPSPTISPLITLLPLGSGRILIEEVLSNYSTTNHNYNNNYDNDNNNENITRDGASTALFAAYTVDTEEEEQVHLGEIVSIKCFALIFDVFLYTFLVLIFPGKKCYIANICAICMSVNVIILVWENEIEYERE